VLKILRPKMGANMKNKIVVIAATLTAIVFLSGTSAATAQERFQQVPQYGFPISSHQMLVLQPSTRITEQQRLSGQPTMDASRRVYPDPGLANTGY
jgi:hypothetical protein